MLSPAIHHSWGQSHDSAVDDQRDDTTAWSVLAHHHSDRSWDDYILSPEKRQERQEKTRGGPKTISHGHHFSRCLTARGEGDEGLFIYMYTREHCTSGERIRERSVIFPSQWKKRWFVQDLPVHLRIERERERRESLSGFCVKRSEFSSLSKSTLMSILFGSRWR